MEKVNLFFAIILVVFFSSCAKNIVVRYNSNAPNTSKVVLIPDRIVPSSTITINDSLIVYRKFVKSVTIENIPEGDYKIHYISDSRWYNDNLDSEKMAHVKKGKSNVFLIGVPPYSAGFWVYQGIVYLSIVLLWLVP